MSNYKQIVHPKLAQHVAEEAQLLAEEKWIIQTLKKIKEQRNCLQIERLHLENKRAQLLKEVERENKNVSVASPCRSQEDPTEVLPSSSIVSMMQTKSKEIAECLPLDSINNEELNLSVTNPVLGTQYSSGYDMEEDEDDMDNCVIDMNMLMNGGEPKTGNVHFD